MSDNKKIITTENLQTLKEISDLQYQNKLIAGKHIELIGDTIHVSGVLTDKDVKDFTKVKTIDLNKVMSESTIDDLFIYALGQNTKDKTISFPFNKQFKLSDYIDNTQFLSLHGIVKYPIHTPPAPVEEWTQNSWPFEQISNFLYGFDKVLEPSGYDVDDWDTQWQWNSKIGVREADTSGYDSYEKKPYVYFQTYHTYDQHGRVDIDEYAQWLRDDGWQVEEAQVWIDAELPTPEDFDHGYHATYKDTILDYEITINFARYFVGEGNGVYFSIIGRTPQEILDNPIKYDLTLNFVKSGYDVNTPVFNFIDIADKNIIKLTIDKNSINGKIVTGGSGSIKVLELYKYFERRYDESQGRWVDGFSKYSNFYDRDYYFIGDLSEYIVEAIGSPAYTGNIRDNSVNIYTDAPQRYLVYVSLPHGIYLAELTNKRRLYSDETAELEIDGNWYLYLTDSQDDIDNNNFITFQPNPDAPESNIYYLNFNNFQEPVDYVADRANSAYNTANMAYNTANSAPGTAIRNLTGTNSWYSNTTYSKDALVVYSNYLYKSLQDNNRNKYPSGNPAWWERTTVTGSGGGGTWGSIIGNLSDQIDLYNVLSTLVSNFAPAWQQNTEYIVGDVIIYNNKLYSCNTAHTSTTTWDSTKWDSTDIVTETLGYLTEEM